MKNMTAKTCQSCGMPMISDGDYGTDADGGLSKEYCTHCYRNGAFTEPKIIIDEMAEKSGAVMSQMYGIPPENAKNFAGEQLNCLKRWAGREIRLCESCGMPLMRDGDCGTEKNGSKSTNYCIHCYMDGKFTEPGLTKDAAVEKYAPMMASHLEIPLAKAKEMVEQYLSTLSRWQ